jgi:hypothetical protein
MINGEGLFDQINPTGSGTFPAFLTGTGTITTLGNVVSGTSTVFSKLPIGTYIYNHGQSATAGIFEVRRIVDINGDGIAYLDKPFTTDITAAIPLYYAFPKYHYIIIKNFGGAVGQIDNSPIQSDSVPLELGDVGKFAGVQKVIAYNFSGGEAQIAGQY